MINTTINFPETIEEYMEEYKIVDSEQIYTNGVELIPVFRIKQWLEAHPNKVEIVRCHDCIYHTEDDECTNGCWNNWSNSDYDELYPEALEMDYCSYGRRKDE